MDELIRSLEDLGYQTIRTYFGLRVFNGNGYEMLVIHEDDRIVEFSEDTWDRDFEILQMVTEYLMKGNQG